MGSCNYKTPCDTPPIEDMEITSYDSTADSMAKIIRYYSGSNFTRIFDTTNVPIYKRGDTINGYTGLISFYFSPDYDFRIIIYPENKTHILKNIKYGNEKRDVGNSGSQSDMCATSISYYIDDSLVRKPWIFIGGFGETTTVKIGS